MNQHEREYFICRIRSGNVIIRKGDLKLVLTPPTLEQNLESCAIYDDAYHEAEAEGVMTESEIEEWMVEQGLWSYEDEEKIEILKKDLERLKVEIYSARNNSKLASRIRLYIRAGEQQMIDQLSKKRLYHSRTCEGRATLEKISFLIRECTKKDGELYNFEDVSVEYVMSCYQDDLCSDSQIRELARNEPWKSLWVMREAANAPLFPNHMGDLELTQNQKGLLIWSQTYDNIQESLDCPSQDVIEDDDMLDGWFIVQSKKREKEKAEQEFENSTNNEKIKNSPEVFIVAQGKQDAQRIDSMNDIGGKMVKAQREALMKRKGGLPVSQAEFTDEKIRLNQMSNNQFKGRFGG